VRALCVEELQLGRIYVLISKGHVNDTCYAVWKVNILSTAELQLLEKQHNFLGKNIVKFDNNRMSLTINLAT